MDIFAELVGQIDPPPCIFFCLNGQRHRRYCAGGVSIRKGPRLWPHHRAATPRQNRVLCPGGVWGALVLQQRVSRGRQSRHLDFETRPR